MKTGRPALKPHQRRTAHAINVRFNQAELATLERRKKKEDVKNETDWLRKLALGEVAS